MLLFSNILVYFLILKSKHYYSFIMYILIFTNFFAHISFLHLSLSIISFIIVNIVNAMCQARSEHFKRITSLESPQNPMRYVQ